MKLGFSGEGFANLLTMSGLLGTLLVLVIFYVAHRRGIDVRSRRFQFKVLSGILLVFLVIPLWFSDLDVLWKLIATIVPLGAGLANYFAIDKMQKVLKDRFVDKKRK